MTGNLIHFLLQDLKGSEFRGLMNEDNQYNFPLSVINAVVLRVPFQHGDRAHSGNLNDRNLNEPKCNCIFIDSDLHLKLEGDKLKLSHDISSVV